MKIRYFGFLCNRYKKGNFKLIRNFIGVDEKGEQPAKRHWNSCLNLLEWILGFVRSVKKEG